MTGNYSYKAVDLHGKVKRGSLAAANASDLEARLSGLGLDLINFRLAPPGARVARVPREEMINFCFHLEQLVSAGVPLVEGLRDLRVSITHARFRDLVAELVRAIEGGKTFSQALEAFPGAFDAISISMVRVGEHSGRLDEILAELTRMHRWQDELVARTRRALVYPAVVAAVVLVAAAVLMVVLVPQLLGFIESSAAELPAHTVALIATAEFLSDYGYWCGATAAALVVAARFACRGNRWPARVWDRLQLRVWFVGPLLHKIRLARFAKCFALMYAAGISVLDAIALSRALPGNHALDQALAQVQASIDEGAGISDSFARTGLFPALVVRMIRVGETSGGLDRALLNVSYFYDRQVDEAIETLTPLLGPALVGLVALALGWIMLAVLGPVYDAVLTIGTL